MQLLPTGPENVPFTAALILSHILGLCFLSSLLSHLFSPSLSLSAPPPVWDFPLNSEINKRRHTRSHGIMDVEGQETLAQETS